MFFLALGATAFGLCWLATPYAPGDSGKGLIGIGGMIFALQAFSGLILPLEDDPGSRIIITVAGLFILGFGLLFSDAMAGVGAFGGLMLAGFGALPDPTESA